MTPPDPLRSPPAINATRGVLALAAVNVAVHALRWLLPGDVDRELLLWFAFAPSLYFPVDGGGLLLLGETDLVRPFSYAFLHGDIIHLLMNMAFLLAFGTGVERRIGTGRFLLLYFACALLAVVGTMALYWITLRPVLVIGASGAVSGMFGAATHFIFRRRPEPPFGRPTARRVTPAAVYVLAFIVLNLVIGYTGFDTLDGLRAVAWEAHIAGFFAGYLLFPLLDRPPKDRIA